MAENNGEKKEEFVQLASGLVVPAIRTDLAPGEEAPAHLLAWIENHGRKWPRRYIEMQRRICTDHRMADFWSWISRVRFNRLDTFRSSFSLGREIYQCTRLPQKPGNLTPGQREAYFEKVRKHANALCELLEGTKFDRPFLSELSEKTLGKSLGDALSDWGPDESDEGHTKAFQIKPHGKFEHRYDYPLNVLTESLSEVMDWTRWDDNWDGNLFATSAPIAQANAESTPIVYFCCTLHQHFHGYGVEIPFAILATVANVALELPPERQVDEDSARKQVRRFQARIATQESAAPYAFGDPSGQKSDDSDNSVLSDPF